MRIRTILSAMTIFFVFILTGCQSDVEKISEICESLETISAQSDNCEEMAKKLSPITRRFMEEIYSDHTEDKRQEYGITVSKCMDAYKNIRSGPCGEVPSVQAALPDRNSGADM